ncbi:MAG TPA: TonB-dependent receptor [Polyangiaceae bacterium]|nr:TonB-dependent receptor [Polyangiaceae bacterium]
MSSRWARSRLLLGASLLLASSLSLSLFPRTTLADGLADEAELHFQLGTDRYRERDFRGALEHFLASNRLVPNRNVVFNIARTFEQMRRYADAHRYYVDALAGETDQATIKEVKASIARIAPEVAVLDIVSSPPGATLYVDRRDLGSRGTAPRPMALPPGKYRIIAELPGYEPKAVDGVVAALGKETRVEVALERIVGVVHVEIDGAPSAAVRIGDERAPVACTAPCDLKLPPGVHQLYFTQTGFLSTPRQVNVAARSEGRVVAKLSPLSGSLVVNAEEDRALVLIDGRSMGFTPVVVQNVAVGRRKVSVLLRGYAPFEREIEVRPNEQSQLTDVRLVPLREVTAVSRYSETIDDAPSSVSIIAPQELRAFGYPTIAEALRGQRGVYLSNDRSYFSAGIRGLGEPNDYGNRVLLLSDGQPLNDNLLNSSYIGSDGRVDLHDVERIEVVRGPGSLLYGTGAFSGVVNLVTRPRDEPSHVHGGFGAYDDRVIHGRVGFHYNFAPDKGVWASASAARSDGRDLTIQLKDPSASPRDRTATSVEAFVSGGTAGRAWWGPLSAQWFLHERTQLIPVGAYATRIDDHRSRITDTRMMGEVRFEPQLSKTVQLMTRAHANRYVFHADYSYDPEPALPGAEDLKGTWFGGEARVVVTPWEKARITVGAEGQVHPEAKLRGADDGGMAEPYLNIDEPFRFAAAYGLFEASLHPRLRVSAGARADIYRFGPIFLPRAAVIVKPAQGGVLKLLFGRAFRAPSIYELYYSDGGISQVPAVQPGRDLRPESVYSGEIEYSQRFLEDWVALGAAHVSFVEDIIGTREDTPGSALVRYQNSPEDALTVGGDVEVRREWRRGWMLAAMYSYQRAQFLESSLVSPRLINAPEHLASFRSVIPLAPEVASLGLRMTLEAPRRIRYESEETTTQTGVVVDATLSGDIRRFGVHYTFGVYNITDFRYSVPVTDTFRSRTIPQNGRTFLLDFLITYP